MSELVVTNWFGDLVSHPKVIVEAATIDDIKRVLTDPVSFPSPVRAVGSNHSTAMCGVADGGTLLKMKGMNKILDIGADTVTAQSGAQYIDVAHELRGRNLQFHVCTEIGNLTFGSAACAGTKDASMPGEYGQVGSYLTAVKMMLPNGSVLEATEEKDPELMQKIRCSYGTFGVVLEATFRVRPLTPVDVYHRTYRLEEFLEALPELRKSNVSMFYYMFPFVNKLTVEFRRYNPGATGKMNKHAWRVRNNGWGTVGPMLANVVTKYYPRGAFADALFDASAAIWRFLLAHRVKSNRTDPTDQTIRYPPIGGISRYTFSLFAFPIDQYPAIITDFYQFCRDYYARTGYRTNLSYVGYTICKDQKALLSYSFDNDVMTLDPVSTSNPGWREFLREYNLFCSERNGVPLLNQTWGVTREIAERAYGDRLESMAATQKQFDPEGRMLNQYFRDLFRPAEKSVSA